MNQTRQPIHTLVTGDFGHPDFNSCFEGTHCQFCFTALQAFEPTYRERLVNDQQLDLVVIVQSRRSQVSQQWVYRIKRMAPLVPIVALLGSWCEGETRSGIPLQGVHRIIWHKWPAQFQEFCAEVAGRGTGDWHKPVIAAGPSLPLAALNASAHALDGAADQRPRVLVSSREREVWLAVRDAIQAQHWSATWLESGGDSSFAPNVMLVNLRLGPSRSMDHLLSIQQRFADLPLIAIVGFPRHQERRALAEAGIAMVSKPFQNSELLNAIRAGCAGSTNAASRVA